MAPPNAPSTRDSSDVVLSQRQYSTLSCSSLGMMMGLGMGERIARLEGKRNRGLTSFAQLGARRLLIERGQCLLAQPMDDAGGVGVQLGLGLRGNLLGALLILVEDEWHIGTQLASDGGGKRAEGFLLGLGQLRV